MPYENVSNYSDDFPDGFDFIHSCSGKISNLNHEYDQMSRIM